MGKKNQPFYKIVVTDKKNPPRSGRFAEQVGFYNPLTKEKNLKADRVKYWLSVGAKPSDTVYNLLVSDKIIEGKKIALHKTKKGKAEVVPESPVEKASNKEKPEEVESREEKKAEEKAEEKKPSVVPQDGTLEGREEKPKEEKKTEEKLEEKKEESSPVEAEKAEEKAEE